MTDKSNVVELRPKRTVAEVLSERIAQLEGEISQAEIGRRMGFPSGNYMSMLKQGKSKLSLGRVESLANILGLDFHMLFELALEQYYSKETIRVMKRGFGTLTETEQAILDIARENMNVNGTISDEKLKELKEIFQDVSSET